MDFAPIYHPINLWCHVRMTKIAINIFEEVWNGRNLVFKKRKNDHMIYFPIQNFSFAVHGDSNEVTYSSNSEGENFEKVLTP